MVASPDELAETLNAHQARMEKLGSPVGGKAWGFVNPQGDDRARHRRDAGALLDVNLDEKRDAMNAVAERLEEVQLTASGRSGSYAKNGEAA